MRRKELKVYLVEVFNIGRKMRKYVIQFKNENTMDSFGNQGGFFKKIFKASSVRIAEKKARRWARKQPKNITFVRSAGRLKDRPNQLKGKRNGLFGETLPNKKPKNMFKDDLPKKPKRGLFGERLD